jgi:alkylhydroperoxidase family enzyme
MEATLISARIASRVAADEYAAASARSTPSTASRPNCPPTTGPPGMARVRREAHMLGKGLYTRPAALDCRMETACETCAYFHSSTQSQPVLTRQRDHAREDGQTERAELSSKIIQKGAASPLTTITRITPSRIAASITWTDAAEIRRIGVLPLATAGSRRFGAQGTGFQHGCGRDFWPGKHCFGRPSPGSRPRSPPRR